MKTLLIGLVMLLLASTVSAAVPIPTRTVEEVAVIKTVDIKAIDIPSAVIVPIRVADVKEGVDVRSIVRPKRVKPFRLIDGIKAYPVLPAAPSDCMAPPDSDPSFDSAPEVLWAEYTPAPAIAGNDFLIRVCAVDDIGVDRVQVKLGSSNTTLFCDGTRACVKNFTMNYPAPGVYSSKVYAFDTHGSFYLLSLTVMLNPSCADADSDGVCDSADNCPTTPNPAQEDIDGDGIGDACDAVLCTDPDGDGYGSGPSCLGPDNCPADSNPGQQDSDSDGIGDACDACTDTDGDLVCDSLESASCVGENLGNMPADTACLTYTFDSGCHVEHYDDGTTVCDAAAGIDYACKDGTALGDDVFRQTMRRYCGLGTGACDGMLENVGDFTLEDACSLSEVCVEDNPLCQPMNLAPVMSPIGGRSVAEGATLTIDVDATDPNADTLTYSTDAAFGSIDPTTGIFTYTPGFLEAGTYTVTFIVSDGSLTDGETITLTVTNTPQPPPSITAVDVTPDLPSTDDVLACTPSGWSSSVGASPSYVYRWLDNGVQVAGQTTAALDCGVVAGCDKGDIITCEVTPVDSEGSGTPRTDAVTIQNSLPVLASVAVTPDPADTTVNLTCLCGPITDIDGDPVSCDYFEIYRNGVLFANGSSVVLPASATVKGDNVTCKARPFDGQGQGSIVTSPVLTIANSPPVVTSVSGWGLPDSIPPFSLRAPFRQQSLITASTFDGDALDIVTVTCIGQAAYELAECTYNFTDIISGPKPAECDTHPESGCFGITGDMGLLTVNLNANDGTDTTVVPVTVNVTLPFLPPKITASNVNVTEGDVVTCPCTGFDPDGGVITNRYCGEPFNGSGNLSDPYIALFADVGKVFNDQCILTDDEGNKAAKNYSVQVNGAVYNINLRSRAQNLSGIMFDENKSINASTTRLLLSNNELWQYTFGNPGCNAFICVNTGGTLKNISDYFSNFQNDISEGERLYTYGPTWPILIDNNGFADANGEVTIISFNITKI